jgi:transcription antitermination factor NusG
MNDKRWYALTARHQHEKPVSNALAMRDLRTFVPLYLSRRRWSDRTRTLELPLFPGYVFCSLTVDQRALALSTPGVTGIVGFGGGPEPIPGYEIDNLMTIAKSGLPVEPCQLLKAGDEVTIDDGPLRGLRGKLLRDADRHQLVVGVHLLQRAISVTLSADQAWPVESNRIQAQPERARSAKAS